jgi:hypothetical protein
MSKVTAGQAQVQGLSDQLFSHRPSAEAMPSAEPIGGLNSSHWGIVVEFRRKLADDLNNICLDRRSAYFEPARDRGSRIAVDEQLKDLLFAIR